MRPLAGQLLLPLSLLFLLPTPAQAERSEQRRAARTASIASSSSNTNNNNNLLQDFAARAAARSSNEPGLEFSQHGKPTYFFQTIVDRGEEALAAHYRAIRAAGEVPQHLNEFMETRNELMERAGKPIREAAQEVQADLVRRHASLQQQEVREGENAIAEITKNHGEKPVANQK
mmetsp:Transcript_41838/g.89814  ORF Transcript_41838/g.89814 Transcript_41838/m.89814 type:complete len:174 (+) Transcript_41838:145-666(+)